MTNYYLVNQNGASFAAKVADEDDIFWLIKVENSNKGYINSKLKRKLKKKKFPLIYPYQKNKKKNTTFEKIFYTF